MSKWKVQQVVVARACAVAVSVAASSAALAGYEVPNSAYAPPTNYYNGATSTVGATLKSQLQTIISTGVTTRSYDSADEAMVLLDRDPNNANNVILIYSRASTSNAWNPNNNVTGWNKEHQWPDSKLSSAANGDLFNLRPCNPIINSTRGNQPFGTPTTTGSYADTGTYWFPGDADKGDVARSLFYVATRWTGHNLLNGNPSGSQEMGDLAALLKYHYTDGVDNFERRRNQYIYGSSGDSTAHDLNPQYYQGNRNPYIDHPEYVWAVFGGGNNTSQIYVGAAPAADGSSATTVNLGRAIVGAALPTGSVIVNKTGANPTTFDITATGVTTPVASALQVGTGQPFDYNGVTRTMTVALSASTATAGTKSGTVTINNTDLTTGGTGLGSADGNDTINVTATVVDHSIGSLAAGSTVTSQALDFGYVPQGFAARSAPFAIANRPAVSGFTADLALNSISTAGSASFTTNAAAFARLAAGSQNNYTATLATGTVGTLSGTHTFNVGDEAIPGATAGPALGLTMTARVISTASFPVTGFIQLNTGETYTTGAFSIASGVTLTKTGPGTMDVTGTQAHGANSTLAVIGGSVRLATDAGSNLAVVVSPGGHLEVQSAQHLSSLAVTDGSPLVDLLANPVTLSSADPDSLRQSLLTGTITSTSPDPNNTLSVGYIPAGATGYLLQLTYAGDANLNGKVDPDDYALTDRGMAAQLTGWASGDFDYSGTVDASDYLLLDRSFGFQTGVLSPALLADREARFGPAYVSELIASVPEPSVIGIAGAALMLVSGRNRRRSARA